MLLAGTGMVCTPSSILNNLEVGGSKVENIIKNANRKACVDYFFGKNGDGHHVLLDQEQPATPRHQSYLTESVCKVVLQKTIPAKIRQLILIITNVKNRLTNLCGN